MSKLHVAVSLLFVVCTAGAQTITGYVYTSDQQPVEYANIIVQSLPDSTFIKGVITYSEGKYSAENMLPGNYYIKSTYVGYMENGIAVEVKEGVAEIVADTIFLNEKTEMLEDVVITGNYVRAKELVDRTVYEILPEIEKTSTNGFEVLRKIPSVQVDFNNNVTLNGSSNFIIQVDGKQREKEFLAKIRPEDIESIEVIQNPSGRYEGDIDGVINVVLKPLARRGISGMIGAQLKPFGKRTAAGAGSLDYGREKITFYVSGFSFIQNLYINSADYRSITLPTTSSTTDSILDIAGNGDFSISVTSLNAGFDSYLNDKNTLSLNYNIKPFSNIMKIQNTGDIFLDQQAVNYQENETNVITKSGESNVSLYYRKKFKKPIQEFTLESNYYTFSSDDNNDFNQVIYNTGGSTILDSTFRKEIAINNRDYFSTKLDYVQPLGVSMRLEAGYQFYLQNINYDFTTTLDTGGNIYDYHELRNAGYATFYWKQKKLSFQGTLRVENSDITINQDISSNYTTFLPATNIMFRFNPKHNIKLNYNRRINRPGIYQLNPYERYSNDLSVSSGNPYLEPELRDRLQLNYTMNIKKVNFSPYIYHEFYSDKIDNRTSWQVASTTGKLAVFSSPENLLTGYEQGFGMSGTINVFNINGAIYRGHFNAYSDSLSNIPATDYFSFRINSFVAVPIIKDKLNAFAIFNYSGVRRTAQTLTYSPMIYGAGFQQNIKDHKFGLFYLLPFSRNIQFSKVITETPVIYSENIQNFDASWFIQFMYSYTFRKGRAIKKTGHEADIESDTKGGGLGR